MFNTAICIAETVWSIDLASIAIPDIATHSRLPTDPSTMNIHQKRPNWRDVLTDREVEYQPSSSKPVQYELLKL